MAGRRKSSRIFEARRKAGREDGPESTGVLPGLGEETPQAEAGPFAEGPALAARFDPVIETLLGRDSPWAERFRTLGVRLRSEGEDGPRSIGIVSALEAEGKTTVAVALAMTLAEEPDTPVLLVEADLRHRRLAAALGGDLGPGLGDWLERPAGPVRVRRIVDANVWVLPAGRPSPHPWRLIKSTALGRLFAAARDRFRYVIVDCPPHRVVADAIHLQRFLDGVLFVVRSRATPRETVLDALDALDERKVLGIVVNDLRSVKERSYGGSYYRRS